MTDTQDRGTGRTSHQMLEAPRGAIFVWCNARLDYPIKLMHKLGRSDLQIASPYWLESFKWADLDLTEIVVDHAAELTSTQRKGLLQALTHVRVKKEAA